MPQRKNLVFVNNNNNREVNKSSDVLWHVSWKQQFLPDTLKTNKADGTCQCERVV